MLLPTVVLQYSQTPTNPQDAYAAFTHGLVNKWSYLTRTIEHISPLLQPLEESIRTKLIPALCGCPAPSDNLRELLALPCRLGGLGIIDPTNVADAEYTASKEFTAAIVKALLNHEGSYTFQTLADQQSAVADIPLISGRERETICPLLLTNLKRHSLLTFKEPWS